MVGVKKPILLDFPESFESERLIIRAPMPGDGAVLIEAIQESRQHLKAWMPWARHVQTAADTEEIIRRAIARWILREDLWMLLFRKSDGLFVGRSGLHQLDWSISCFEIGYWVRASLQGQGYISEAVAGITDFAFGNLGAERIEIRCDQLNERSAAVAQRAGYKLEGMLRHDELSTDGNGLRDTLLFGTIRADWEGKQAKANA